MRAKIRVGAAAGSGSRLAPDQVDAGENPGRSRYGPINHIPVLAFAILSIGRHIYRETGFLRHLGRGALRL